MPNQIPRDVLELLGSRTKYELRGQASYGRDKYYLFDLFDDETGGQCLIRHPDDGEPVVLAADTVVEMLERGLLPPGVADQFPPDALVKPLDHEDPPWPDADATPRAHLSLINALVYESARECENVLSSANAPGTNNGRLACAWAVNTVVERKLGRPVGGGLSTIKMHQVLKARHFRKRRATASPGTIIISPTQGSKVGHVGIMGENEDVFSNSSTRALWVRNFTVDTWNHEFITNRGLPVYFFDLNPGWFPDILA